VVGEPEFAGKHLQKCEHDIILHAAGTSELDANVWAACLLMFFTLLRRSNVFCPAGRAFDGKKHLLRQDILFHPWGVQLRIKWTKTIQFKERCLEFPIPRAPRSLLCPVQALTHAFSLTADAPNSGPALVLHSGTGYKPLTASQFAVRLRQCVQRSGHQAAQFTAHSFRRGGASFAYEVGVGVETIRQLGDWRSMAYTSYITVTPDTLKSAVKLMQDSC
jgi:integrase